MSEESRIRRILMIEDFAEDRLIYKRYLKRKLDGQVVYRECESGAEGLAAFLEFQPDLVLLDYSLPDMDGIHVLARLGGALGRPEVPVVMLTGMGNEAIAVQALKNGAMDYLVKDNITSTALHRTVINAVEKHRLVAELDHHRQALERSNAELETRNADLRASKLELEREVAERRQVQQTLLESEKHFRKMAEFSASVIHNLGNLITNISTSVFQMRGFLESSQLKNFLMANRLIDDHLDDFERFVAVHPKGKLLPRYLLNVGDQLRREQERFGDEIEALGDRVNMMRDIIEQQQTRAKQALKSNPLDLNGMLDKVLDLHGELIENHEIEVFRHYFATRPIFANRAKSLQILINLIKNAIEAMADNLGRPRHLTLRTSDEPEGLVLLQVTDNGCGIAPDHLTNLFAYGFSTKKEGHGFGLPYCALAMKEMGGEIRAHSDGMNMGTTFSLRFRAGRRPS
ncbi:Response regulator [Sulfidibacter corallicola]|uniref:histidine kinase n=1 Tax=Sulfidibacter corallicola TaxID=2818388 RepID=A0A8A4TPT9_SULCO|nr:response regulator [Sulfidibacter corallicola]QTD51563.1 response regulator [Sulfidibacter corallicola]